MNNKHVSPASPVTVTGMTNQVEMDVF